MLEYCDLNVGLASVLAWSAHSFALYLHSAASIIGVRLTTSLPDGGTLPQANMNK